MKNLTVKFIKEEIIGVDVASKKDGEFLLITKLLQEFQKDVGTKPSLARVAEMNAAAVAAGYDSAYAAHQELVVEPAAA